MSLSRVAAGQREKQKSPGESSEPLSEREAEVLQLVAMGLSSRQIAQSLEISTRTVESHRGNMLKKLSVASTAELLRHYYLQINNKPPN